jgi:hypothetical protein
MVVIINFFVIYKVIKGNLVAQLVLVVTLAREILRQSLTDAGDDLAQAVNLSTSLEETPQFLDLAIPEPFGHYIIDARVTQDGKLAVLVGHKDQYGVAAFGGVQVQTVECPGSTFHHIAATPGRHMDTDFSSRVTLGCGNGVGYAALAVIGNEIDQCTCRFGKLYTPAAVAAARSSTSPESVQ